MYYRDMKLHISTALVLVGIGAGCGAATVAAGGATPPANAQAVDGRWTCAVVDRLPDVDGATNWDGAQDIAAGLNAMAAHVEKGEILSISPSNGPTYSDVVCVKN